MLIKKMFYVEMEIEEDGLSEEDIEEITHELDLSACDIDEMIEERIEYSDFNEEVNVMAYDVHLKEGKPFYHKIVDTNFEKGYITLQPTEIENV